MAVFHVVSSPRAPSRGPLPNLNWVSNRVSFELYDGCIPMITNPGLHISLTDWT